MGKSRVQKKRKTRQRPVRHASPQRPETRPTEIYIDEAAGRIVARNLPGIIRMSEVISHLAQPVINRFAQIAPGPQIMEQAIRLTIFAWNATLMWSWWRNLQMWREAYRLMPHNVNSAYVLLQDVYQIVSEGKRLHYPDVKRRISDVHFYNHRGNSVDFDVLHYAVDGSDKQLFQSLERDANAANDQK